MRSNCQDYKKPKLMMACQGVNSTASKLSKDALTSRPEEPPETQKQKI